MTFVILGASGHTGKVAAETLLAAKQPVRVLVRSADKGAALKARGAEVAIGDITDVASLREAFAGAKGVYMLLPPDVTHENFLDSRRVMVDNLVQAAREAKVGHVVLLSSVGAQLKSGTGPILSVAYAEKALDNAGIPRTFVRAAYFLENYGGVIPVAQKDGVLPTFFPVDASSRICRNGTPSIVTRSDLVSWQSSPSRAPV